LHHFYDTIEKWLLHAKLSAGRVSGYGRNTMGTRLFSADGIRGIVDKHPLRREDVERLGRVLAVWLRQYAPVPTFLIGADTRESSQRLKASLANGLARGGVRVVDAGILPTAAISYLIISKGYFAGGAMVSASHNPLIENGIKVFNGRGIKVSDETESLIENLFFGDALLPYEIHSSNPIEQPDFAQHYVMALAREVQAHEQLHSHVVIDCAHGAASQIGPAVLEKLHISHTVLNASPDGININYKAGSEYVRFNPRLLAQALQQYNASVGVAFDGDADRVVFVDRQGRFYDGDMILAMLSVKLQAEQRLQKNTVVVTPMSSSGLMHYLHQRGIATREVQNGDKYITRTLVGEGLTLGGEEIGHIIAHTDHLHVTGDGLRTALLVFTMLAETSGATLQDLAPGMRKWPQIKVAIWIGRGAYLPLAASIPGLLTLLSKTCDAIPDLQKLECRPASTEPVYRVMMESRMTETTILARHALVIAEHIQQYFGRFGSPIQILDCAWGGCMTEVAS
jgi:phosphoglucosamine mutase